MQLFYRNVRLVWGDDGVEVAATKANPLPVVIEGADIAVQISNTSFDINDRSNRILGRAGVDLLTDAIGLATSAKQDALAAQLPAALIGGRLAVVLPAGGTGLTNTELRASAVPVDGSGVTQPVSLAAAVDVSDRAAREVGRVRDHFSGGEALADQAGAGAALTFTFSAAVHLVWVRCDGAAGRADPFGGTPTAAAGIYCDDGIPNPITVATSSVKVYAAPGTTVRVWGFRE